MIYLAFEGTARLTAGFEATQGMVLVCAAVLGVALAVEMLVFRCTTRRALSHLGFGRPSVRSALVGMLISLLLLAFLPVVSRLTGAGFVLTSDWPRLAFGVFAMNGIAEEVTYRGYLFRHLRQGRPFWRALPLGMALHAVAHLPILATAGVAVWAGANLVALASFPPFAYAFERGRNTIWAPALMHFAVDSVKLVLTADLLATPAGRTATFVWMAAAIVAPYLAFVFLRRAPLPSAPAA